MIRTNGVTLRATTLLVLTINSVGCAGSSWDRQSPSINNGPCEVGDLEFDVGSHHLKFHGSIASAVTCEKLGPSRGVTGGVPKTKMDSLLCDQVFEKGYFYKFKEQQPAGRFLRDVSIPLFTAFYPADVLPETRSDQGVVLPAIEHAKSGAIDWETEFFLESRHLKNQLTQASSTHFLNGDTCLAVVRGCSVLPLDKRLSAVNKTLCFRRAYFEVPELSDQEAACALPAFLKRIRETLAVHDPKPHSKRQLTIGLALPISHVMPDVLPDGKHTVTKKISSFAKPVDIDYTGMSLKEQVMQTQNLDVVIVASDDAMSLASALYLPPWGMAVKLNMGNSGRKEKDSLERLLESRGVVLMAAVSPETNTSVNNAPAFSNNAIVGIEQILQKAVAIVHHNLQKL